MNEVGAAMGAKNAAAVAAVKREVLATGIPATARVVQMGTKGEGGPFGRELSLVLEVHPPRVPGCSGVIAPFIANVEDEVPSQAMAHIRPGSVIPVKFDLWRMFIDFVAMGFPQSA